MARLKAYVDVLTNWNARHNLVSAKSLDDVWRRHVWDRPSSCRWCRKTRKRSPNWAVAPVSRGLSWQSCCGAGSSVTLFEATRKKCDFLVAAAERMQPDGVGIQNVRIEAGRHQPVDVVTARALAPLDKLLGYAQQFAGGGTVCLFLKGQSLASELTEARKSWRMKALQHPSATDPSGVILEVRELRHVQPQRP